MRTILAVLLLAASPLAFADDCLQTDKKGHEGDSRYYDYGKCTPAAGSGTYGALGAIGAQMQGMAMQNTDAGRGYSDAEREADRASLAAFVKEQQDRRARVKVGASVELGGIDYSAYQFQDANASEEQKAAIRAEIGAAINAGKLVETYGGQGFENASTWASKDPAARWKACEVATQLVRAYAYGDFARPEQKNPAKGLAIAQAGYAENCGGTAYWLGRIYEDGDARVKGVDKILGKYPKSEISRVYDTAILNGYTPAYERMAELYRLGGPARYRDKTYYEFPASTYPYWRNWKTDSDQMYMTWFQYGRCLQAEPANLVCARGLRYVFNDESRDNGAAYTNYNKDLAAFYDAYVKKLEALLAQAGQPVAATP